MSEPSRFGEWVDSYRNGFGVRPAPGESGPIVLRIADVSSGLIDLSSPRRGVVSEKQASTYRLQAGDLLFIRVNGAREIVGRCCVVGPAVPKGTIFNDHLIRVRLKAGVDPEFARLCVSLPAARVVIEEAASTSAGQLTISQSVLERIEVPCVAIEEQRQIAARLKAQLAEVDTARLAARAQARDAAVLRTKIVDATFNALSDWRPIADAAKVQSGYAFKSESFKPSGVRLLRNTNILPGRVYWDDVVYLGADESERHAGYVLREGDVLISLDRPVISSGIKVARVGTEDLPALLLQRVGRFQLKPDLLDAGFLFAFLQSTRFIDAISGHEQSLGVPHISPAQVEAVELPIPSLADQRRIVTRLQAQLAEADAIAQAAAAQLAEIEKLPQQLLAQAFATTPGGNP